MPLTILHLSDAHVGHPERDLDSLEVFDSLLSDLTQQRTSRGLDPSVVIFSGDAAFGSIGTRTLAEQYARFERLIREAYEALNTTLNKTPLVIVPGNHDVDRTKIDVAQTSWLDHLRRNEDASSVASKEMAANSPLWRRFLERLQAWADYASRIVETDNWDTQLMTSSLYLQVDGTRVGVFGFNTAWASVDEHDRGRLLLGKHQLQKAQEFVSSADFAVAVSHHPPNWLNGSESNHVDERLQTRFSMHFHGHEHAVWFQDMPGHSRIAAGPCYEGSAKDNAYSWIRVDFDERRAEIFLRRYTERGGGGWGPYAIEGKTDNEGRAELVSLFHERQAQPTAARPAGAPSQTPKTIRFTKHKTLPSLVSALQDHFGFRWEPYGIDPSADCMVYWPVRLRRPLAIHAVQAFAAAALQRRGARVSLFLDDLGTKDHPLEDFRDALKRWFKKCGGSVEELDVQTFSNVLVNGNPHADPWPSIQRWLGHTTYTLVDVMRISKLMLRDPAETTVGQLEGRPRRLLTPALVWTCLLAAIGERAERVITLGGYDEQPLWQAWRDCAPRPALTVGHLYIPQLKEVDTGHGSRTVHMAHARVSIDWNSKDDILRALREEANNDGWADEGRLVPWSLQCCASLPRYLNNESPAVARATGTDLGLAGMDRMSAGDLQILADELERWML